MLDYRKRFIVELAWLQSMSTSCTHVLQDFSCIWYYENIPGRFLFSRNALMIRRNRRNRMTMRMINSGYAKISSIEEMVGWNCTFPERDNQKGNKIIAVRSITTLSQIS